MSLMTLQEVALQLRHVSLGRRPDLLPSEAGDLDLKATLKALEDITGSFRLAELERLWVEKQAGRPWASLAQAVGGAIVDDPDAEAAQEYLQGALEALREGKVEDAVTLLQMAHDQSPRDERIHMALGFAYLVLDELERAMASFQEALKTAKDEELRAEVLFLLGKAEHMRGNVQGSWERFREAARIETHANTVWTGDRAMRGRSSFELARSVGAWSRVEKVSPEWQQAAATHLHGAVLDGRLFPRLMWIPPSTPCPVPSRAWKTWTTTSACAPTSTSTPGRRSFARFGSWGSSTMAS
jgi:tetratricopeptide (TPR) repeat protein